MFFKSAALRVNGAGYSCCNDSSCRSLVPINYLQTQSNMKYTCKVKRAGVSNTTQHRCHCYDDDEEEEEDEDEPPPVHSSSLNIHKQQ